MAMQVSFSTLDYGDEAASGRAVAEGRPPGSEDDLYGSVILRRGDGQEVAVQDDLLFLVPDLCGTALARLEAEGSATVTLVDQPNGWTLVRTGDEVSVSDMDGTAIVLPFAELVSALRECGRRFAAFIDELGAVQGGFEWAAAALRAAQGGPQARP